MTYPPQPGYSAPPNPYAPAGPQHPIQQAYAQQAAPAVDVPLNIVEPGSGGGEWAPAPRHLYGRAVIGIPRFYDPSNMYGTQPRPSVTVDFVVASVHPDGTPVGPLEFGDSQARDGSARPNCFRVDDLVAEFTGARWNNQVIVDYIAPLVGTGQLFMGRFIQGTQGNKPPLINALAPDDAARQILTEAWKQRTANPGSLKRTPVEINGGPPKKAEQQQAPPHLSSAWTTAPGPQPGYGGPPMPPGVPQGAQVQYGPPPPPPGAMAAQQQAPLQSVPPAALAQGWTPESWAMAPPPVKAAYGG